MPGARSSSIEADFPRALIETADPFQAPELDLLLRNDWILPCGKLQPVPSGVDLTRALVPNTFFRIWRIGRSAQFGRGEPTQRSCSLEMCLAIALATACGPTQEIT
jgi:hypothetical protein